MQELKLLDDESSVYKLIGPALIKQDPLEAKHNVEKRLEDYVTRNVLDVDFTPEESKKVGRKMDRYLLSILIFLQISFYVSTVFSRA